MVGDKFAVGRQLGDAVRDEAHLLHFACLIVTDAKNQRGRHTIGVVEGFEGGV